MSIMLPLEFNNPSGRINVVQWLIGFKVDNGNRYRNFGRSEFQKHPKCHVYESNPFVSGPKTHVVFSGSDHRKVVNAFLAVSD